MTVDLRSLKKLYVHDSCADGLAAALIIKDALPDIEVRFVQYLTPEHKSLKPEPGVIFCDFTPFVERDKDGKMTPVGLAQAQAWAGAGTVVLDHHKGASDLVAMFGERGVFADAKERPGVSGATLAYEEVWYPLKKEGSFRGVHWEPAPLAEVSSFACTAGIYDTWQTQHPSFREAQAQAEALLFWPRDLLMKDGLLKVIRERLDIGEVLLQKNEIRDKKVLKEVHRFNVGPFGTQDGPFFGKVIRVACFDGKEINEVAEKVKDEADLVLGWHYFVENCTQKMKVSCRSRGWFDCSKFAQAYGGNGHHGAAGFVITVDNSGLNPYQHVESLLRAFAAR